MCNLLVRWFIDQLEFELKPSNEPTVHRIIITSMVAYTFLMAVPFVPGVEIGLAVLMILGPKITGLVYLCTLTALCLSFFIGRFIPERTLISFLWDLRLHRASRLLSELQGLEPQQRLSAILQRSPQRFTPFLLKYRYLALMVAVNLPGNIIFGGGGGIAMIAGISRLFTPTRFAIAIALAIAPVPLAWLLFGEYVATWTI